MKINKISSIKSFGCYKDFNWQSNLPDFCQYNFFYGWNYSGKTILSRILRCLEIKETHKDFPFAEFKLKTDNGDISYRDIGKEYSIRVFNEEFIEDNFDWNNEKHEIEPVIIFGKQAKDLVTKVEQLNKQLGNKKNSLKETQLKEQHKKNEFQTSLTTKATEIRGILNITNQREFDRNALENIINQIVSNSTTHILATEKYQTLVDFLRDTTHYEEIISPDIKLNVEKHVEFVKTILSKKVSVQQIIEKLKNNPALSNWVSEGIDFHKDKETECQFCGNALPTDLINRLEEHFSEDYKNLINEIDDYITTITNLISEVDKLTQKFPDKARIFKECQSEYESAIGNFSIEVNISKQTLVDLISKLNHKKIKPFDELALDEIPNNDKSLRKKFTRVKYIFRIHNRKIQNIEKENAESKNKIKFHHSAKFIDENKYFARLRLFQGYTSLSNNLVNEIENIQREIQSNNNQIIAEAIGAEKINDYLLRFFNNDKLIIKRMENGRYKLYRDEIIAKNLSTGERNIISLIYFFAKLEESNFNLSNAIIFIDDPVSSLDSNHIFGVYGFLSEKLRDCGQLFITTHNFDFFNLLKDLKFYRADDNSKKAISAKRNFYLVRKTHNDIHIETLPKVLEKYKSEYNYLFSELYSFNSFSDKNNYDLLYILPNIVRRFLEAYLFMKYPDGEDFKLKCRNFFRDTDHLEKQRTLKLIDEYSHEQNPEHSQKFPDVQEVESVVNFILKTIERKDKEHYDALCDSLNN